MNYMKATNFVMLGGLILVKMIFFASSLAVR
jgi:hypothetical protein